MDTFLKLIKNSWCRETSYYPNKWTEDNPAFGQCAVTALVIQQYFGGEILCGTTSKKQRHYWNVINSKEIDLTFSQFKEKPIFKTIEVRNRKDLLKSESVSKRYEKLFYKTLDK